MRSVILTLLALALLPTVLAGCGSPQPDTLVVSKYMVGPGMPSSPPADVVYHDPYDIAAPQYLLQRWQNTDAFLVQLLSNDALHAPTDPGGHGGPDVCFGYWYLIAFQQGARTLAFVRLSECPVSGIVLNDQRVILLDTTFWHILTVDMHIPPPY
jgi:hypothetical protein